ncbi:MAG: chlorite dismutase [Elusimicrobia bacterium RIFCSPLOWO2_01_FULL_54_10]|nr:MAG: chlorite dismutase [Elusimicrobia bacterium RIFCSPLOWO2_01_FULL_54_10]
MKSETSTSETPAQRPQTGPGAPAGGPPLPRQYVSFKFFKVRPDWRLLDAAAARKGREEALQTLQKFSKKLILLSYSTAGTRADCDLMLWMVSYRLEDFEELVSELARTGFGKYLDISTSYLSMTKRSNYIDKLDPSHSESRTKIIPGKHKYIFVYPFWKTRDWYLMPWEKRQEIMDEHIRIGSKYISVKLNTTYSFGLDDQEFVVAFETDSPSDFLDLVMELRESQGSKYTLRDTPIFTCVQKTFSELLAQF